MGHTPPLLLPFTSPLTLPLTCPSAYLPLASTTLRLQTPLDPKRPLPRPALPHPTLQNFDLPYPTPVTPLDPGCPLPRPALPYPTPPQVYSFALYEMVEELLRSRGIILSGVQRGFLRTAYVASTSIVALSVPFFSDLMVRHTASDPEPQVLNTEPQVLIPNPFVTLLYALTLATHCCKP